jgi:hypothetical protein
MDIGWGRSPEQNNKSKEKSEKIEALKQKIACSLYRESHENYDHRTEYSKPLTQNDKTLTYPAIIPRAART